jgi:hypothetical protein
MPKLNRKTKSKATHTSSKKRKSMRAGGFMDSIKNSLNSINQKATETFNYLKNKVSNYTSKATTYGGAISENISMTNLASNAGHFNGPTAKPHTWVGGKTRKRKHKKTRTNKA